MSTRPRPSRSAPPEPEVADPTSTESADPAETQVADPTAPEVTGPTDLWATVDALWTWLDANSAHRGREGLLLRVLKLSEEVGEVAQAVIGATGQNPRKGVSHTWEDVQGELCDVAITALVALRTLTPEAEAVFAGQLARVAERSVGPTAGRVADRSAQR
ncbi:MazG-like family protein [Streptomyces sp. NBC_00637]|uniref:MazG-like family protein n=1 Tax=Streptomyces sp. NBC_00637 TaxID=2903667 RepID=UPI00386D33C3